jgi:aldehyde dehydrogenase (NAD+)
VLDKRQFYINGQWVDAKAGTEKPVIDPSTELPFATIALGGQADTDAAVAAARAAFPAWRKSTKAQRLDLIRAIRGVYMRRSDEMGAVISREVGAPLEMSIAQQARTSKSHFTGFLDALEAFDFDRPLRADTPHDRILYEPIGVAALITPWNWPMKQIVLKVIPALASGCTAVLKPSEQAPLSAMLFAEILHEAGVPSGVFNMLNGDGQGVGAQLSAHRDVDMVSFTGSTDAGRAITRAGADTVKRVCLELGGKGANMIFADADADAVQNGVMRCFNNSGQSCNAPSRMLVERSRYDEAVAQAKETAEAFTVGGMSEAAPHIGPVVNASQFDKIQNLIAAGIDEGARLVAGGLGRPDGLDQGFYVRPTVFADCTPDMAIMRTEIFGPVLSMMPFDTEDEAIAIANDTDYGLTNYVQTADPARARRIAREVRSGMVEINEQRRSTGAPFGGMKQSGNGREGGIWGLEEFLEVRAISGWPAE